MKLIRLLIISLGVVVATVLIAVVYRCWGTNEATLLATWVAAIIVLVYTVETHGMKREMIRQNDISIQPLLITSIVPPDLQRSRETLAVRNIGRGPALFIRVDEIKILIESSTEPVVVAFDVVDLLEASKSTVLEAKYAGIRDFAANLNPKYARDTYRVTLRYEDINKRERYSVMQMGKDGLTL